jgi:hypothetical protein
MPAASAGSAGSHDVPAVRAGATIRALAMTARFLPHVVGTEIHTYRLVRRLGESGVETTILTTERGPVRASSGSRDSSRIVRVRARVREEELDGYRAPFGGGRKSGP